MIFQSLSLLLLLKLFNPVVQAQGTDGDFAEISALENDSSLKTDSINTGLELPPELAFPIEGQRCSRLKDKHRHKQDYKLKLYSLLERNLQMQSKAPPHKQAVKQHLDQNQQQIKRELKLTLERLAHMEEDMVRKGCPGIRLQHVSSDLSALLKVFQDKEIQTSTPSAQKLENSTEKMQKETQKESSLESPDNFEEKTPEKTLERIEESMEQEKLPSKPLETFPEDSPSESPFEMPEEPVLEKSSEKVEEQILDKGPENIPENIPDAMPESLLQSPSEDGAEKKLPEDSSENLQEKAEEKPEEKTEEKPPEVPQEKLDEKLPDQL